MEDSAAIGIGEEVASKLDTNVATTRRALTSTVAKGRKLVDHVGITTPALCDGVGGVLECEATFELPRTDLELWESAPLGIEIYELNGGLSRTSGVSALNLGAPVEVANLTIEDETSQTEVEGVRVVALRILSLILQHAVATELDVLDPLGEFDSLLLLLGFLDFLLFGRSISAESYHQHRE